VRHRIAGRSRCQDVGGDQPRVDGGDAIDVVAGGESVGVVDPNSCYFKFGVKKRLAGNNT